MEIPVEYHKMRPKQIVERRTRMPVAYMGLGILEWHGLHNPVGLDGVKAHGIACCLAQRIGGIVMPPQFWGDDRRELAELVFDPRVSPWLPEGTVDSTEAIAKEMKLDKQGFQRDAERSKQYGGWELWEKLMVRSLFQMETLGFRAIVAIPGHYPLFMPLERASARYREEGGSCPILALKDTLFSDTGDSGDHAARFETSLMLALYPELTDLSELEEDLSRPNIGVLGEDPRVYASREFGQEILDRFEEITRGFIVDALGNL